MEKTYITHYFNNTPPRSGLLDLDFLTATAESLREKKYFLAYDMFRSISEDEIRGQLEEGTIRRLPDDVDGGDGRALWMDKNRGVWVADSEAPFEDETRRLVFIPKAYVVPEELGGVRMTLVMGIYRQSFSGAFKARAVGYQRVPRPEDMYV